MPVKINNPEAFAKFIEKQVREGGVTYMEAVLDFCDKRQIEPEQIAPFISDKIKRAIAKEGKALHLLKNLAPELPLDELA